MPAIINFLQQTGFYMFGQDGNGKCLIMIAISFILMYLAIVKGFEPLLLLPISFGMLCTNLPGADMFHEILFPAVTSIGTFSAARPSQPPSLRR